MFLRNSWIDKADREKMTQIAFETFNVPALYIAPSPLFSLYSTGRTTGIAVDSGYERTDCVPIHEGHCIQSAVRHLDIGGLQIGDQLRSMLKEKGYSMETRSERELVTARSRH